MDLSLFNNSANRAAASDAKPTSPSRANANSRTQPESEKFSSMLDAPQKQTPTKSATPTTSTSASAKTTNAHAQKQPSADVAENRGYTQPNYTDDPVATDPSMQDAETSPKNARTHQAAMDQTLFDSMGMENSNDSGLMQQSTTSLGEALQAEMDPTLLQAQAVTAKATSGVPVKVQAILDFIFKSDGLSEKAPVLASLKAQAKTPLLDLSSMADNPFFKQLETSPNPDEILKRAVPIGELLSQLQVSPNLLLALSSAGFDLQAKVTPEQLMKAVGITPDRLASALNMASQATPTGLHELTLLKNSEKGRVVKETPKTHAHTEQTSPVADQSVAAQQPTQRAPQQPTQAATPTSPLVPTMAKAVTADPYKALGGQASENKTTISFATSETAELSNQLEMSAIRNGVQPLSDSSVVNGIAVTSNTVIPSQHQGVFKEGTLDALLRAQFSNELKSSIPDTAEEVLPADADMVNVNMQPAMMGAEAQPFKQQGKMSSPLNLDQVMTMQKMPISPSTENWENKDDLFMGESDDLEAIELEDRGSPEVTGPEFSLQESHQQHGQSRIEQKTEAPAKEPVSESHFAEKAKEIFNKAEMLVKDGGGAMKIDMSSEDLGKLDLAVDVQGDKVDLRIIASSEKVKELLAQDIPKLRDALSNQNLELKNVEISQQNGSWNFNNQSQERSSDQNMKQGATSGTRSIDSMRAFTARPRTYANPVHHSGKIQVLV